MRELLFKNITSKDKKRKLVSCLETRQEDGINTRILRHFICLVKESDTDLKYYSAPSLYVVKEQSCQRVQEKFYCRIKGGFYAVDEQGRNVVFLFLHTLKVVLTALAN